MKKLKFDDLRLFYINAPLVFIIGCVNILVDHGSWIIYWAFIAQIFCLLMIAITELKLMRFKELQ